MFPANTRILVVDDMMTMRKLVIKALKEIGFSDFIEAADGAAAWTALTSSDLPVGLIVSDWNMPNSTGIDLLKRVRSSNQYKNLSFLLVTAESDAAQVKEALTAGVTGYIVKPFTVDSIKEKLEVAHKKQAA